MYKNFNRNLKTRIVFPKINRDKPALSKRQERLVYYFTIVGTIASTILAIASIFLTINISQQSTKIEKMDSLLNHMATQNKYQNENIKKLTDLQNSSMELSEKLSEQIILTKEQTNFLQDNSAPDIALGSISFAKSNMRKDENILRYDFNNIGGRRLKDLHSQVLMFLPTPNVKDSIYYLLTLTPNISDGNTTDLKPNSRNYHYISIPTHKILDSIFTNCFITILVNYKDPLNSKTIYKPFFYQNMTGLDGNLISIYAPPKQMKIMRYYIDTCKEYRNIVNRKLIQF